MTTRRLRGSLTFPRGDDQLGLSPTLGVDLIVRRAGGDELPPHCLGTTLGQTTIVLRTAHCGCVPGERQGDGGSEPSRIEGPSASVAPRAIALLHARVAALGQRTLIKGGDSPSRRGLGAVDDR